MIVESILAIAAHCPISHVQSMANAIICRILLKHFVTMEVIRWVTFWEDYKSEFEVENSVLGGGLGEKALEDLRQRVIEHVSCHAV